MNRENRNIQIAHPVTGEEEWNAIAAQSAGPVYEDIADLGDDDGNSAAAEPSLKEVTRKLKS